MDRLLQYEKLQEAVEICYPANALIDRAAASNVEQKKEATRLCCSTEPPRSVIRVFAYLHSHQICMIVLLCGTREQVEVIIKRGLSAQGMFEHWSP